MFSLKLLHELRSSLHSICLKTSPARKLLSCFLNFIMVSVSGSSALVQPVFDKDATSIAGSTSVRDTHYGNYNHDPLDGVVVAVESALTMLERLGMKLQNEGHVTDYVLSQLRRAQEHITTTCDIAELGRAYLIIYGLRLHNRDWEDDYKRAALVVREILALHMSTPGISILSFKATLQFAFNSQSVSPELVSQICLSRSHILDNGKSRALAANALKDVFSHAVGEKSVLEDLPSDKMEKLLVAYETCTHLTLSSTVEKKSLGAQKK